MKDIELQKQEQEIEKIYKRFTPSLEIEGALWEVVFRSIQTHNNRMSRPKTPAARRVGSRARITLKWLTASAMPLDHVPGVIVCNVSGKQIRGPPLACNQGSSSGHQTSISSKVKK